MSGDLRHFYHYPLQEAIRRAPSDAATAVEVLSLAAQLMRAREVLPYALLDYLAGAFEAVVAVPEERKAKELTRRLNLTAVNRRPSSAQWIDAYRIMQKYEGLSKAEILKKIMKLHKVSRSHASEIYKEAQQAQVESDSVSRDENISQNQAVRKPIRRHAIWRAFAKYRRLQPKT